MKSNLAETRILETKSSPPSLAMSPAAMAQYRRTAGGHIRLLRELLFPAAIRGYRQHRRRLSFLPLLSLALLACFLSTARGQITWMAPTGTNVSGYFSSGTNDVDTVGNLVFAVNFGDIALNTAAPFSNVFTGFATATNWLSYTGPFAPDNFTL